MVGLLFILVVLGLWLIASAVSERDLFFGFDIAQADLILGSGSARIICGAAGATVFLIGVLGLVL